jgi:hypothetical protein
MPFESQAMRTFAFSALVLPIAWIAPASAQAPPAIKVLDAQGALLAQSHPGPRNAPVALAFQREYQPGDHIVVTGPSRMAIRVDDRIPECLVYLAGQPAAEFDFAIPYGKGEPQTRSAFSADSFDGSAHRITARTLTSEERTGYRNLAQNACDQELQPPAVEGTPAARQPVLFPHASTNSVSRSLPDFRASNAIDGMYQNGHHGMWPFQSWGPELRSDLWWKIDFGRPVEVDKLRLMVRADFPHDSYWKTAVIEFSDGTQVPIEITPSPEFQDFTFPKRKVSWMRLNKLVPTDPARWCAFPEVQVWGSDLK